MKHSLNNQISLCDGNNNNQEITLVKCYNLLHEILVEQRKTNSLLNEHIEVEKCSTLYVFQIKLDVIFVHVLH